MHLRYSVLLDIDPCKIEGSPVRVVADEIKSTMDSLRYVRDCDVEDVTEHERDATPDDGINPKAITFMLLSP